MFVGMNRARCFDMDTGASSGPVSEAAGSVSDATSAPDTSSGTAPWYSSIENTGVRDMMAEKGFDSPDKVAEAYFNSAHMAATIPGENATPEEVDAFQRALGRPETIDGYDLKPAEGGADNDPALETWARDTFFKLGLSGKQGRALYDAFNAQAQAMQEQVASHTQEEVARVKQSWGDRADTMIDNGRKAVKALGLDMETLNSIEQSIQTAPMLNLFAQIGERMGTESGKFVTGSSAAGDIYNTSNMSVSDAQARIAQLNEDKSFMEAYLTDGHPAHEKSVDRMVALYKAAYPSGR